MITHLSLSKGGGGRVLCPSGWILALLSLLSPLSALRNSRHFSSSIPKNHPHPPPLSFSFASVSGSNVNLFRPRHSLLPLEEVTPLPEISANVTQTCALEREWLFQELGVWDPPWSANPPKNTPTTPTPTPTHTFQRDENYNPYSFLDGDDVLTGSGAETSTGNGEPGGNTGFGDNSLSKLEPTLSRVKVIPDSHHVSAFLHKGVVKRFLFINDKFGNPLHITITPCTSILHWVVQLWPVFESNNTSPNPSLGIVIPLKTFRTQRPTTFSIGRSSRGVYSVDIRPINYDSYVHIYATTGGGLGGTSRLFSDDPRPPLNRNDLDDLGLTSSTFIQHVFTDVELELVQKPRHKKEESSDLDESQSQGQGQGSIRTPGFDSINTNLHPPSRSGSNKPKIWAQRLSGNRLHVRWDTSPQNPHLMEYCLVVNTRRDYSSLCSATGERYGVLPPDLMHVTYYGQGQSQHQGQDVDQDSESQSDQPRHKHRHRHGQGTRSGSRQRSSRSSAGSSTTTEGPPGQNHALVIGCTNKKTNYILNGLEEGRLYYFNVFARDTSSNVSLPYVRTTLKYYTPKNAPNTLRDNKATQIQLFRTGNGGLITPLNLTVVKFNLNKPCSELTLYVMPCGGGLTRFQLLHGANRTVYTSSPTDTLDIVKIALPQKGKYFLKLTPVLDSGEDNWAKMVEVLVAKKNRRLPLPRLPAITTITEEVEGRSCDTVKIQWWPSPDPRDNEYCIFLKEEVNRGPRTSFTFKKPNQCDVDRSLRSDPYVTHSLCVQKTWSPEIMLLSQQIIGLSPGKTYVVQLILRRHNGKSLSYDLTVVKTLGSCSEV